MIAGTSPLKDETPSFPVLKLVKHPGKAEPQSKPGFEPQGLLIIVSMLMVCFGGIATFPKSEFSSEIIPYLIIIYSVFSDTGLIYMWNRWQDPETGRFLSEDPARAGLNWYSYANNSPLVFTDPTGLVPTYPGENGIPPTNTIEDSVDLSDPEAVEDDPIPDQTVSPTMTPHEPELDPPPTPVKSSPSSEPRRRSDAEIAAEAERARQAALAAGRQMQSVATGREQSWLNRQQSQTSTQNSTGGTWSALSGTALRNAIVEDALLSGWRVRSLGTSTKIIPPDNRSVIDRIFDRDPISTFGLIVSPTGEISLPQVHSGAGLLEWVGPGAGGKLFTWIASKAAATGKTELFLRLGKWSRTPLSLQDQLTLEAAKLGRGRLIIENLGGGIRGEFAGMEKWAFTTVSSAGLRSEVHFVRNPATGQLLDFKFVLHALPR